MHDLAWFLVFAPILITPFLPALLRAKCPSCARRKLESLDTLKLASAEESTGFTFITTYRCQKCEEVFKRVKSGALQHSSADELAALGSSAVN